jgi:hypothetical protein
MAASQFHETSSAQLQEPLAFTGAQRNRIALIAIGVPAIVALAGIASALSWIHELPDPVAVHWGATGIPDGFGSAVLIVALLPAIGLIFGGAVALSLARMRAVTRPSWTPRILVVTSVWLSVFLTYVGVGSLAMQRGLADAAEAGNVLPVLGVGFAVSIVPAVVTWFVTPRPLVIEATKSSAPTMALGSTERVYWSRTTSPHGAVVIALGVALIVSIAISVALLVVGSRESLVVLLAPVLIVVICVTTTFWRVRVSAEGLSVRSAVGFPRFSYPLAEITAAKATTVSPLGEFGGWGLRFGGAGRFGIIVQSGTALEVTREGGKGVVVTVDDAQTAAAVLNGLLERSRS